jgi:soluble lytic murein transglycosylase-like protein
LLALFAISCFADIYSFVDSKGVRHISNKPSDPRFKKVMETPTYKTPTTTTQSDPEIPQVNNVGVIQLNGSTGWKVISPNSDRRALAALTNTNYIQWGKRSASKPFGINDANRRKLSQAIARIAAQYRLDPHLIHAVISAESGFNPNAVSPAGAQGLMQLMPATARRFGVTNTFDPIANMHGGARYLRWLLNLFKNNVSLALAGYNAGENAVIKYGYKIPPYKETQTYVPRVLGFYQHYRSGKP